MFALCTICLTNGIWGVALVTEFNCLHQALSSNVHKMINRILAVFMQVIQFVTSLHAAKNALLTFCFVLLQRNRAIEWYTYKSSLSLLPQLFMGLCDFCTLDWIEMNAPLGATTTIKLRCICVNSHLHLIGNFKCDDHCTHKVRLFWSSIL